MKILLVIGFVMALALSHGAAGACFILNEEKAQVGSYKGIKGICSNNRMPITCILMEGTGIECDGPSGGYTGYDLNSLIFLACGCSSEEERERYLKEWMEGK